MALFMYNMSMRWSTFRFDSLALLAVTATALLVTFLPSDQVDVSSAGLALSYAISVSVMLICNCFLFAVTAAVPVFCFDTFMQ